MTSARRAQLPDDFALLPGCGVYDQWMKHAEETPGGWRWEETLPAYRSLLSKSPHLSLGRWGEWLALVHLRRLGWDVVARNWRTRAGEIDLIAYDGPYLVFAEVKTRRLKREGARSAQHNFNSRKGRKMEQLALAFCRRHSLMHVPFRLDLIAIETANRRDFALTHYILPERAVR